MRRLVLKEGARADGRGVADIRPITSRASVLPRTHGSALFTRGETQARREGAGGGRAGCACDSPLPRFTCALACHANPSRARRARTPALPFTRNRPSASRRLAPPPTRSASTASARRPPTAPPAASPTAAAGAAAAAAAGACQRWRPSIFSTSSRPPPSARPGASGPRVRGRAAASAGRGDARAPAGRRAVGGARGGPLLGAWRETFFGWSDNPNLPRRRSPRRLPPVAPPGRGGGTATATWAVTAGAGAPPPGARLLYTRTPLLPTEQQARPPSTMSLPPAPCLGPPRALTVPARAALARPQAAASWATASWRSARWRPSSPPRTTSPTR
jgi:hypothetical protein